MASLTQMIDKDPRILNDQSFRHLAGFLTDSSPMVRENSLSLIAKCLEQNLSLDRNLLGHILNLMVDTANGPKKKAIKLSRDIYASTNDKEKRLQIATELLLPILDDDKAVVELTRQSLEDIWLGPLQPDSKLDDSQMRLNHETRLSLLVDTVQNIQGRATHLRAFEAFLTEGLSARAKNSATNLGICKDLVGDMVERVIGAEAAGQARILQTLSIFAKVESRLFTADQVQLLKLYLNNLANAEEVAVFRPTAVIFRYVFPTLPSLQEDFLGDVRQSLGKVTSSLSQFAAQGSSAYKETLLDVAHCIWTITPLLKGDPARGVGSGLDKLITFMVSILFQLLTKSLSMDKVTDDEKRQVTQRQIASLMILLGIFGKVCDFDQHVDAFRTLLSRWIHSKKFDSTEQGNRLLSWKGASVALLFLEVLLPHSKQTWDVKIREQALCSMGEICYRNPRFFMRADIGKALGLPFLNKDLSLVRVVLTQLRDYLAAAERRSESGAKIAVGDGSLHGAERMEISFVGSDSDTATTHLSRSFLPKVVDIALSQADDLALLATDIIVSISRQGLEHPKECGPALVALSTSPNAQISQRASAEHQRMHRQHESIFEKEYVVAIRMTFDYQRTVCNDPNGVNKTTSKPKMQLLFEAFKDGTRKTLKKFVTNLFRQMDFDLPSLNVTVAMSEDVLYARFCLENFALFDYARVDDVSHVILTIENIVLKKTGPSVVFAIETDLQPQQLLQQAPGSVDNPPATDSVVQDIKTPNEIKRLRQITTACMILQMMWETRTYLRKVYTLQGKITPKDMLKPATRLYFLTGKDLLERFEAMMKSLESPESMRKQCDEFVEIINIDKEHAVDDGDGEGNEHEQAARLAAGYETPEEEAGEEASAPASGRGRKRKSSAPLGNTPKKSKGRPAGSKIKKRNSKTPDGDDNWD
jgi:cohesin loading factor subunit SCC2